ncbi:hypothetical protein F4824DRAFT_512169 [Ustulina deusta]|nr:hypothetical protein F4824DRAFT_512169 [Ustulina deusta]
MADGVRWCASPLDAEVEEGHQAARRLLTLLNGFKKRIGDFARRLRPGSSLRRLSRDVLWPLLEKEMGEVMERVTQLNVVDQDDMELSKDNIIPTDLLIEYCSGLVVIEPESKIVRFVHSITQEYFEAEENTPLSAVQTAHEGTGLAQHGGGSSSVAAKITLIDTIVEKDVDGKLIEGRDIYKANPLIVAVNESEHPVFQRVLRYLDAVAGNSIWKTRPTTDRLPKTRRLTIRTDSSQRQLSLRPKLSTD